MGDTVKDMTAKFEKLDKFKGNNFRRWQNKMHFLLTTLKVVYVLSTSMPEETMQDFKHSLKHNKDELSLVQLGSHFRIEETLRAKGSGKGKGKETVGSSSVNMIKDGKNKNNYKNNKAKKRKNDATYNIVIHQMDVKTTFLNGDLEVEAPKQWHQKFDEAVLSSGFVLNQSDKCVYCKFDKFSNGIIIFLYVDDMLIFETDQDQVNKTKEFLSLNFSIKDMREADVILGIRIKHEVKGITITPSHYIEKILKKFKCDDCCPVGTPLDPNIKLMPNTCRAVDQLEYSRAIGCLIYAMTSTRLDIAYVMGKLNEDTEEEEFVEEKEPQKEEDIDIDDEEDKNEPELTFPYEEADPFNPPPLASDLEPKDVIEVENTVEPEDESVPASVHEIGDSSTTTFLREDGDRLLPSFIRRDIDSFFGQIASLSRRVCGCKTAHALVKNKGKAKYKHYGKLIANLGNEMRSSMEEGVAAMENLVRKLGNAEERAECKKLKKELEKARFSNTLLRMQNERVERDLYWTRVQAHEFYREMICRGVMFEERPNEAIDVSVEDEESPSF
uniref:Reverse transcriptase Ty1/copia-type domain-containing protein n=1 Tax=Tanacetum cinerariifolium TaxID=118510 RepID=A0A6L2M2Y8_TANCI|nr:hypothetical protein [Tanacetum cinerariifolium]